MDEQKREVSQTNDAKAAERYEAPAIETVVSKESLEREVQYAGGTSRPQ